MRSVQFFFASTTFATDFRISIYPRRVRLGGARRFKEKKTTLEVRLGFVCDSEKRLTFDKAKDYTNIFLILYEIIIQAFGFPVDPVDNILKGCCSLLPCEPTLRE